jgi:hypothetical protein
VQNYSDWVESLNFVLPDGRVLVSDGVSRRFAPDAAGGQHAHGVCEEPFRTWRYHVRTRAQVTTAAELAAPSNPPTPPQWADVALEATLSSSAPAWDLSPQPTAASTEVAFASQYRQLFDAVGVLTVDGVEHPITATGMRAHSTGAHHRASYGGHSMISVRFPSGRAVGFLRHIRADLTPTVAEAFVLEHDELHHADIVNAPLHLPELRPGGDRFTVILAVGDRLLSVEVEVDVNVASIAQKWPPDDGVVGSHDPSLAGDRDLGLANEISYGRFVLDGELGYGIIERSARLPLLRR